MSSNNITITPVIPLYYAQPSIPALTPILSQSNSIIIDVPTLNSRLPPARPLSERTVVPLQLNSSNFSELYLVFTNYYSLMEKNNYHKFRNVCTRNIPKCSTYDIGIFGEYKLAIEFYFTTRSYTILPFLTHVDKTVLDKLITHLIGKGLTEKIMQWREIEDIFIEVYRFLSHTDSNVRDNERTVHFGISLYSIFYQLITGKNFTKQPTNKISKNIINQYKKAFAYCIHNSIRCNNTILKKLNLSTVINYKLVNALIILFADNLDSIKTNSQFNDITPHKRKATKTKSHPKKPRTKTSEFIQDDHSPQPLSAPASPIHHPSEPLKKRALEIVADTVSSPIVASIDFSDPLAPLASQFSSPALEDTSSSSASISTESFDLLDPFDSQFSSPALEDTSSSSASVSAESFDLLDPFDLQFSSPALEDISSSSASVFFDSLDSFDHIDSITSQFPIATKDASSVPVHSNHVPFSISSAPAFIDSVRDHSRENRAFYGLSEAIKKRALENRQKAETRFNEPGLDFIQDLFSTFYKSEEPISVDSFENHCKKKSQEKNRPYSKEEKCSFKKYKTAIENYFLRGKKCEGIANRMSKKILQQIIDDFEDSPLPLLETIKTRIDAASRFKPVFKRKIDDHSPQHLSAPASPIHPLSEPIKKRALEADTVSSSTFASIDSFDSIDSITSQFPIGPEDASLVPIHSNHVPFSSSVPASIDSAQDHSLDFLKDLFETYYKSASTCSFNRLIAAKCDKRLDSTQKTQLLDFCNLYRRKLEDYFLSENSEVRLPAVMRKDSTFEALITNLSNYGLLEAIKKRALENKQKAESRFKEPGLHSANSAFVQKVFSTFYTSEEPISFDSFKKHCKKKLKENKGSYSKNTTMHTLTIYKTEIENYFLHGKKLDGTALKKASMTTLKKIIADLEKWPSEFIKKRIEAAKKPSRPSIPSAPSPTGSIPDHL